MKGTKYKSVIFNTSSTSRISDRVYKQTIWQMEKIVTYIAGNIELIGSSIEGPITELYGTPLVTEIQILECL